MRPERDREQRDIAGGHVGKICALSVDAALRLLCSVGTVVAWWQVQSVAAGVAWNILAPAVGDGVVLGRVV